MGQYEVLRQADCDIVQGYLFSAALSFDDVIQHLQRKTMLLPEVEKNAQLERFTTPL